MARKTRSTNGMALLKGCAAAAAALSMAFFTVGCGDDGGNSRCGSGEIYAAVGGAEATCHTLCDTAADCGEGFTCSGSPSICRASTGGTDNNPPGEDNNPPGGTNNPIPTCDATAVCNDFCDRVYDTCLNSECSGNVELRVSETDVRTFTVAQLGEIFYDLCMNGFSDPNNPANNEIGCIDEASANPQACVAYRDQAATLESNCDAARGYYCGGFDLAPVDSWQNACGCDRPSTLSAACASDESCDGGEVFQGFCIPETATDEGGQTIETGYEGGYCSAYGCEPYYDAEEGDFYIGLDDRCGAGGLCLPLGSTPQEPYGACLKGCTTTADCARGLDEGYSCRILLRSDDRTIGMCWPTCDSDDDCSDDETNGRCSTTSGQCEFECDPAAEDSPCVRNGGTCEADAEDETKGFCVLS